MVKSTESHHEDEDDYEEDLLHRFSSQKEMGVKVDGKSISNEQKGNMSTQRSKHSETEQRRRCKINERFQILRDLIPQNDQKRDKASFLLEVIEYVQFLQEKIRIYEGPHQGWNQESPKINQWINNPGLGENLAEHTQFLKPGHENNLGVSSMLTSSHNSEDSDFPMDGSFRAVEYPPGQANTSSIPLQGTIVPTEGRCIVSNLSPHGFMSSLDHMSSQAQFEHLKIGPSTSETSVPSNGHEPNSDSRTSCVSNAYSQGVFNTLSQSLQNCGLDLSQTSIAVQIDVGKKPDNGFSASTSFPKIHGNMAADNQRTMQNYVASLYDNSYQSHKRLRTGNS